MAAVVKCPTCGVAVEWLPTNLFRPFCSERCKQIDLGAWASERYTIPVADDDDGGEADQGPLN